MENILVLFLVTMFNACKFTFYVGNRLIAHPGGVQLTETLRMSYRTPRTVKRKYTKQVHKRM